LGEEARSTHRTAQEEDWGEVTFGYVVRPRADRDIDEIVDYLGEEANPDTALRFLAEIYETFHLLSTQQKGGWLCKVRHSQLSTARTFRVSSRFEKYLIFYQPYDASRIEILRFVHGSQDLEELFDQEAVD
jgi:plasmid stabilization system protein ParE